MKKRSLLTTAFITVLLLSALAGTHFVNSGRANPYSVYLYDFYNYDWVSPPDDAKPPIITILAPKKSFLYNSDNVALSFNANISKSKTATYMGLMKVYYRTDWQQNRTYVYNNEGFNLLCEPNAITDLAYNINLTGVQDGEHYITVYVVEWGAYIKGWGVHMFSITGSSSINFTIDGVSPSVSVMSLENRTFDFSDVPLYFTVSEPVSRVVYSLDGQENVTIAENITLTNLPYGEHNITVFATDEAGNTGASGTITFTVAKPEPFLTVLVAIAVATIVVLGAGLLVYFKKRKR